MANQYKYGRAKERLVAQTLRDCGAEVELSPGSKGSEDLVVKFPTRTKWIVQVKATREGEPKAPGAKELGKLKAEATRRGATPVVAKVARNKITFSSARSGRKLTIPNGRKK